jgi:hypothetical protein
MFDGANQDPKATAALTTYRSGQDGGFAIADLTAAYAGSGATRVHRGVTLRDTRTRVLIQDEVETSKPVELTWTMHTQADVEILGNRALLSQGGAVLEARLMSPPGATFTVEDVEIAPPQQPAPDTRRLLVRLPEVTTVQIAVLFTPRRGLSIVPGTATVGTAIISTLTGTPGTPGTLVPTATPTPSISAETLPLPEIVDLSRWAVTGAPLADDAQT